MVALRWKGYTVLSGVVAKASGRLAAGTCAQRDGESNEQKTTSEQAVTICFMRKNMKVPKNTMSAVALRKVPRRQPAAPGGQNHHDSKTPLITLVMLSNYSGMKKVLFRGA